MTESIAQHATSSDQSMAVINQKLTDHVNGDTAMNNGNHNATNGHTAALAPVARELTQAEKLVNDLVARTNALITRTMNKPASPRLKARNHKPSARNATGNRGRRIQRSDDDTDDDLLVAEIDEDDGSAPPTVMLQQPALIINCEMRVYQLEGLNWLIRLFNAGISGILADEMGLGKTLQTISLIAYLHQYVPNAGPHLVLTPLSTLGNWAREFARFCPSVRVMKFHGSKEERAEMKDSGQLEVGAFDVLLTSYEMGMKEKSLLNKIEWQYIIIDEAHRLKNENSILSQIVRMFSSQMRLLLTGTPLQNNLHELWALLNFLIPDIFSSHEDFDAMFSVGTAEPTKAKVSIAASEKEKQAASEARANGTSTAVVPSTAAPTPPPTNDSDTSPDGQAILQQLHKILRPFMLRRLKAQVAKDLPPKHEVNVFVKMSELQTKVYQKVLIGELEILRGNVKERSRLQNLVMQLRKAANHPYLFEGYETTYLEEQRAKLPPGTDDPSLDYNGSHLYLNSGKMAVLHKLMKRLKADGHRVLIFTQMTKMLDILEDYMLANDYPHCRIDGNTAQADREVQMKAFNEPGSDKFVFILSTRSGGLGINLWTADTVIIYDSDWNPQMDLQAMDRAHRIGQTKQVSVYRFVIENSIEETILERAAMKLRLDRVVIQNNQSQQAKQNRQLSNEEMLNMIRYGADKIFASASAAVTDEDIESILARGEQRTAELNAKLTAKEATIMDLTFDASAPLIDAPTEPLVIPDEFLAAATAEEQSLMLGRRKAAMAAGAQGQMNVDNYYRDAMKTGDGTVARRPTIPRPHRVPNMKEHQFFNEPRINELHSKEADFYAQYAYDLNPPAERGISAEEETELLKLLDEGYKDWSWSDFHRFLKACRRYGKDNISKIATFVGKSLEETRLYKQAFFEQEGWKRVRKGPAIIHKIQMSEATAARFTEAEQQLETALSLYTRREDVLRNLPIRYGQMQKDKGYTIEEDRYLLWQMRELGYGEWKKLKEAIQQDSEYTFDYWLLSRSTLELRRRVNALIRTVAKNVITSDGHQLPPDAPKRRPPDPNSQSRKRQRALHLPTSNSINSLSSSLNPQENANAAAERQLQAAMAAVNGHSSAGMEMSDAGSAQVSDVENTSPNVKRQAVR